MEIREATEREKLEFMFFFGQTFATYKELRNESRDLYYRIMYANVKHWPVGDGWVIHDSDSFISNLINQRFYEPAYVQNLKFERTKEED